jgi:hypothetical protein
VLSRPFYDPLSERWVKPRPERKPDPAPSWAEVIASNVAAAEAAALAVAQRLDADRIWAITKQVAEGCCAPTRVMEAEGGETV